MLLEKRRTTEEGGGSPLAGEKCWKVEDSFSRLSLMARCSPENQRLAVEWCGYINVGLVYTHAETQVRNERKVTRVRRVGAWVGVGEGRGLCVGKNNIWLRKEGRGRCWASGLVEVGERSAEGEMTLLGRG